VGWLVPEITKPVTLNMTADDVKREAMGRTLSIAGAAVGIAGGLMILSSNPAITAAFAKSEGVTLSMTPTQATRNAWGKTLGLLGMGVGIYGSVLNMSSNPKMKAKFGGVYEKLPAAVKNNQRLAAGALALAVAGGIWWMIQAQNKALAEV
jgi:hypothetical protein